MRTTPAAHSLRPLGLGLLGLLLGPAAPALPATAASADTAVSAALADGAGSAASDPAGAGGGTAVRPADEVDRMIEAGRRLLADGRPDQALVVFEDAAERDGRTPRTRAWIARAWMAQDRVNDALDLIDDLAAEGLAGFDLDYLYGMGFWHKARKNRRVGADLSVVDMLYEDARGYLQRATAGDPDRYRDAFLPLAETAWFAQELELARRSIERAVALEPKDAEAHLLLGRIALSQQKIAADAGRDAESAAHLDAAVAAFERSAKLRGKPRAADERAQLAQTRLQLGYARVWQQALPEAAEAFADALGWAPGQVDIDTLRGFFDAAAFRACLEQGAERFDRRHPDDAVEDATLLWWLGWARFEARDLAAAERAFLAAVEKRPDFTNTWVYLALARYHRKDFDGAVEALRTGWDADGVTVVAELARTPDLNLAILDYLVGRAFDAGELLTAAELSRIQAEVRPEEPKYWNNVGLFYRDGGEALAEKRSREARARAADCYERSWAAYSRALALRPEDPALLNDAAVVLHYYLERDLDRARRMYADALRFAERALARPDLPADLRELYRTARRDARNNLDALDARRRGDDASTPPR